MNMRKNGNQIINIFLIIIIIINLFASIFIIFGKEKTKEVEVFEIENFNEFTETCKVTTYQERYKTFVEALINKRFDTLYEDTKNLSDNELKKYYEENSVIQDQELMPIMQGVYGISDYNTFNKLVTQIKLIKEKDAKYKSCKIVRNSCELQSKYTLSELVINYTKFQKITLTIRMANYIQEDTPIFTIQVKGDE